MFDIVADALTPLFLGMSAAGAALLTAFCLHVALLRVRVKLSSRAYRHHANDGAPAGVHHDHRHTAATNAPTNMTAGIQTRSASAIIGAS